MGKMTAEEVTGKMTQEEVTGKMTQEEVTGKMTQEEVTGKMTQEEVTGKMTQEEVTGKMTAEEVTDKMTAEEVTDKIRTYAETGFLNQNSGFCHFILMRNPVSRFVCVSPEDAEVTGKMPVPQAEEKERASFFYSCLNYAPEIESF